MGLSSGGFRVRAVLEDQALSEVQTLFIYVIKAF